MDPAPTELDLRNYVALPAMSVASMVALAIELLQRVPTTGDTSVREAANDMKQKVDDIQHAWKRYDSTRGQITDDPRTVDVRNDAAWTALFGRLDAWNQLDILVENQDPLRDDIVRAARIIERVFPNGCDFLKLEYHQQWAEGNRRLQRIDDPHAPLTEDIEHLAGAMFLQAVRATHEEYGRVLGLTESRKFAPPMPNLQKPLNALREAIEEYVLRVLVQRRRNDNTSLEMVVRALQPIDTHRAAATARRAQAVEVAPRINPSSNPIGLFPPPRGTK